MKDTKPIRRTADQLSDWLGLGMKISKDDILKNLALCEEELAEARGLCEKSLAKIKKIMAERNRWRAVAELSHGTVIVTLTERVNQLEAELAASLTAKH
jgi:hypothetical protein